MSATTARFTVVMVLAACLTQPAFAAWMPQGNITLRVEATGGGKTAVPLEVSYPVGGITIWPLAVDGGDPGISQQLTSPDGTVIGTIQGLQAIFDADPAIALNFVVVAGAADTTFKITASGLNGTPLIDPDAFASAVVTVTDTDWVGGATLTGLYGRGLAYEASYDSIAWAELISPVNAAYTSRGSSDRRPTPPTVRETIIGSVSSMQAEFNFTLTANDSASGTSRFDIVPEPATLSIVGLGALGLLRRRRGR